MGPKCMTRKGYSSYQRRRPGFSLIRVWKEDWKLTWPEKEIRSLPARHEKGLTDRRTKKGYETQATGKGNTSAGFH
jgi:hypothetical protein